MTAEHSFRPGYAVAPGETLAELIEERAMTQTEVARRLGISLKHANQVVRGSASISAELALGLEKVFDIPAGFWLSRESFYRAALARQSETQDLSKWVEWAKRFPLRELKKRGQIAKEAQGAAVVEELLRFLGVASPELWQEPAAAYRRSRRFKSDPYALAAWLRVAEASRPTRSTAHPSTASGCWRRCATYLRLPSWHLESGTLGWWSSAPPRAWRSSCWTRSTGHGQTAQRVG